MEIRAVSSQSPDIMKDAAVERSEGAEAMFKANANANEVRGTSVERGSGSGGQYRCITISDGSIKYNGSSKDGYIIKDNQNNELGFFCTDTGWFSCDQIMGITSGGKFDGHCFKFRCTDDDKLNADEFCWDNNLKTYRSKNGYKVKQLECVDDESLIFKTRTTGKGAILVEVDNQWLTLEEFMAYDPD